MINEDPHPYEECHCSADDEHCMFCIQPPNAAIHQGKMGFMVNREPSITLKDLLAGAMVIYALSAIVATTIVIVWVLVKAALEALS